MKIFIACVVCVVAGAAVGWYAGHTQAKHETTQAVRQMMETIEGFETAEARTSIRAITLIESGQAQKASEYLSRPIATYARRYGQLQPTDQRTNMMQQINAAAETSPFVARRLKEPTR